MLVGLALVEAAQAASEPPNFVIIFADDLGINDLSCYGRQDQPTPHLDRLAASGLRFTASYCAQPICSPSRAALLTGKAPARLHLTTYLPGRPDAPSQKLLHPPMRQALPVEEITIAERLRDAGYATACIGKWHLGGQGHGPREQGFDVYYPGRANTRPSATEGGKGEYELTRAAERFIAENRDRRFFLYLAHNTPHIPLGAKPELVEKHQDAFNPVYAAMMETLDDTVGRLLAKLAEQGLSERTVVIFTSDNGGLHVLEGGNPPATHNTPYRAGKGYVYEGGLRVPLIVAWPGVIEPGVVDTPVINTDWTATLSELAGLQTPEGLDGISFVPLLRGTGTLAPRPLFWHFPHYTNQGSRPAGAMRDGDWKLVEHYENGQLELYHLADDPGEQHDLASVHPERAKEMQARLADWRSSVGAQQNEPNPAYDPAAGALVYGQLDTSRLPVPRKATELAAELRDWRAAMDSAIRGQRASRTPGQPEKQRPTEKQRQPARAAE